MANMDLLISLTKAKETGVKELTFHWGIDESVAVPIERLISAIETYVHDRPLNPFEKQQVRKLSGNCDIVDNVIGHIVRCLNMYLDGQRYATNAVYNALAKALLWR